MTDRRTRSLQPLRLACLGASAALALSVAAGAVAQDREDPVRVEVDSLFGRGTLLAEGWVPAQITLQSLGRRDLRGTVHLRVQGSEGIELRHEVPLALPAGQTRTVVLPVFARGSGYGLTVTFEDGSAVLGRASRSVDYGAGDGSVVVFDDPPRLRGALLDLEVGNPSVSGRGRRWRIPVGTVPFEAATSDPRSPSDALGWSTVKVLVAGAPAMSRASEAQRRAIGEWLEAGGRLLVFPRTVEDLSRPWLVRWTGPLTADVADPAPEPEPAPEPSTLVAPGAPRLPLACGGESQRVEAFGCSAPVGFGRVFVASYDGSSPAAIESGAPRELVRSVYAARSAMAPALPFGRQQDDMTVSEWATYPSFGTLRAALDPNEGFRPALLLVALVLLLYVVIVGPLNFRWVQRRNRPTLALLTTPAAAFGCLIVLLGVGYVGKGVRMRYRRVEVLEMVEGRTRANARRYTGLYSTRPGSFDLPGPEAGAAARRVAAGGDRGPVHRHGRQGLTLASFRAGLWETIFLREDRRVDLRGPIELVRDGRRLSDVRNGSDRELSSAVVIDTDGSVYPVGGVRAGGSAPIPRRAVGTVDESDFRGDEARTERFARQIGLSGAEVPYLRGVARLCGPDFVPAEAPVLYARLAGDGPTLGGRFDAETDQRWLRLAPRLRGAPVAPEPVPVAEGPWAEPSPPQATGADAGADANDGAAPADAAVASFGANGSSGERDAAERDGGEGDVAERDVEERDVEERDVEERDVEEAP